MPAAEPSLIDLPGDFRVAWATGAVRPDRHVAVAAPAGVAFRLSERGADALDALVAGGTVAEASAAAGVDARPLVRLALDGGLLHPRPAGTRYTARDVTVVVPARDAAAHLPDLLASLAGCTVVVVDDGSVDDTARIATGLGATVVGNPVARGPAAARNRGAGAATTPLVAFVDADCRPGPGWLDTLVRHFDDPAVGAVAPRIVAMAHDGSLLGRYEAARSVLDRGPDETRVGPDAALRLVPTAALVVRASALDAVGGLADDLRFGEDQDLVYRLAAAGWRLRYDPGAEVGHDHRTSLGPFVRRRFGYGTPAAMLGRRHGALEAAARLPSPALLRLRGELVALGLPPEVADGAIRRSALHSARSVGNAATRAWLVPAAVVAVRSRAVRAAVVAAVAGRHVADWRSRRPPVPAVAWVGLRVVDEAALAAGIWWGALRTRTSAPLRPAFATADGGAPDGVLVEAVRWVP
jgi:mycofactocin system glycosyltransferase